MPKKNTGVSIEEEVLERNDRIRDAIKRSDEFGREIERSELIEELLKEWNEEHAHYLKGDESGNRMTAVATAD
jgi:metal-responsive CopG/Arc/MetJ family transcriptional regulator